MRRATGVPSRIVFGLALTLQSACIAASPPGELPRDSITGPLFPIDGEAALRISKAALAAEVRADLIEPVTRPYPGHRGWLRFVVGLDSLTIVIVAGRGVDADGHVRDGYGFAVHYDGSYAPGGQAMSETVLQHATRAAEQLAEPLAAPPPRTEDRPAR
jgi:hypothetical protein